MTSMDVEMVGFGAPLEVKKADEKKMGGTMLDDISMGLLESAKKQMEEHVHHRMVQQQQQNQPPASLMDTLPKVAPGVEIGDRLFLQTAKLKLLLGCLESLY